MHADADVGGRGEGGRLEVVAEARQLGDEVARAGEGALGGVLLAQEAEDEEDRVARRAGDAAAVPIGGDRPDASSSG